MVEWCPLTCPFHIAQAHQQNIIRITYTNKSLLLATNRPVTQEELFPPCFCCLLGEGDTRNPDLIQCERSLRWIHSQCLPKRISKEQLILAEGWTCHECEPPSITKPCPHQICTIQFPPTPHTAAAIHKLSGGRRELTNYLNTHVTTKLLIIIIIIIGYNTQVTAY
jgi:hypothetical protein